MPAPPDSIKTKLLKTSPNSLLPVLRRKFPELPLETVEPEDSGRLPFSHFQPVPKNLGTQFGNLETQWVEPNTRSDILREFHGLTLAVIGFVVPVEDGGYIESDTTADNYLQEIVRLIAFWRSQPPVEFTQILIPIEMEDVIVTTLRGPTILSKKAFFPISQGNPYLGAWVLFHLKFRVQFQKDCSLYV